MPSRPITIQPPYKGVVTAAPFEGTKQGELYDAKDVLPRDYKTERNRLAVRPGYEDLGADATNMLAILNVAPDETYQRLLLMARGGEFYTFDPSDNTTTQVGSNDIIKTGVTVLAAPYLQKLYIANHDLTPKVFDGDAGTIGNWTATTGSVPSDCTMICEWSNRIVMAGDPASPHVWYMSRIGDPRDWLYATDDASSPVAATDIDGGNISEPITALIPHNRDCIIFGYASGMTILRGNPAAGGSMERLSYVTGPVNPTAWCRTPDDWTYFICRDGLYKMPPGCGTTPVAASEQIPQSLKGVDGINTKAYLVYDVLFQVIHIYLQGDTNQSWFYDAQSQGFWPQTLPGTSILATCRFDPLETTESSGALVATAEGVMRLDKGTPLGTGAAYAKFGPLLLAPLGSKQLIERATVKLGSNTDDNCTLGLYAAESTEAAAAAPDSRGNTMTATALAANHMNWYPRVGGHAAMFTITQADNTKHWSFEAAAFYVSPTGKER